VIAGLFAFSFFAEAVVALAVFFALPCDSQYSTPGPANAWLARVTVKAPRRTPVRRADDEERDVFMRKGR